MNISPSEQIRQDNIYICNSHILQVARDGNESLHLRIPQHEDTRGSMALDISDEDADRRQREHSDDEFTTTELAFDESMDVTSESASMDVTSESATDNESMDATVESAADDVDSIDATSGSMNITTAASFNVSVPFRDRSALEERYILMKLF